MIGLPQIVTFPDRRWAFTALMTVLVFLAVMQRAICFTVLQTDPTITLGCGLILKGFVHSQKKRELLAACSKEIAGL
jgi:hypothetical protein